MAPSDFRPLLQGSKAVAHGWVELLNCWTFEKAPPQNSQKPSAVFSQTSSKSDHRDRRDLGGSAESPEDKPTNRTSWTAWICIWQTQCIPLDNILNSWCFLSVLVNHVNMINIPFGSLGKPSFIVIYSWICHATVVFMVLLTMLAEQISPWDAWRAAVALPAWAQPEKAEPRELGPMWKSWISSSLQTLVN